MEDEQEKRFLHGRYVYRFRFQAEEDIKKEFRVKLKSREIERSEVKFESVTPDVPIAFLFESAGLLISALSLLYTIYSDRKKKDAQVSIRFPNMTVININNVEDFEAILEKLKQVDPQKEDEERRQTIEHFKAMYKEAFGDKTN